MARGTVIFWKENEDQAFGFIADDADPNNRDANLWFGLKSLCGMTVRPRSGDRVDFDPLNYVKKGRGRRAVRVRFLNEGNEHEHQPSETSAERSSRTQSGAIHQTRAGQITTL